MATQEEFSRQDRLYRIVNTYFSNDNDGVVFAILETTGQRVTVRSVQAWLIAPDKASHRKVPEWAIKGLEDYVQQPGKAQELKELAAMRQERRLKAGMSGPEWVREVRSKLAVEFATHEIESDKYKQQQWIDTFGREAGNMLFERISSIEKESSSLQQAFGSLLCAIDESSDLDELKKRADESIRSNSLAKIFIREARTDIELGSDEFSNPEGLPAKGTNS